MQDIPPHDQNISFAELKAENTKLKATIKVLTERNEFLARLVLDLQETVNQLKDEMTLFFSLFQLKEHFATICPR